MSGMDDRDRHDTPTLDGAQPVAGETFESLPGDLGDRFRLLSLLGRGGMGEVYAAEDLTLGRKVALKAIRPERRLTATARERFQREARLLSRLDHPGICRIHDLVTTETRDFLVLELIEGRTLRQARSSLDGRGRQDVALQIAAVLEAAHAEDVVHRDLKPENIMLTPDGTVKVLDFGLARDVGEAPDAAPDITEAPVDPEQTLDLPSQVSRAGAVMGTPAYLSPEQARGETATPASDMFAFGLVMQRLFTGQMAYEESGEIEAVLAQARQARTRPVTGIDRDLIKLIESLKDRSPAARPTAVETRRKLGWIQRKPARRLRRLVAVTAVLLVLAGAGKYMMDLRHERAIAQRNRAEAEDLVEFMLGDLRATLEDVGRLDAWTEVGDRALAYFASRTVDERTDADHDRYARAMTMIGGVRWNQGDLEAAQEAFSQAHLAAAALVKRNPNRSEWLMTLGVSEFYLGAVALEAGDQDAAEASFRAYLEVAERGVAFNPTDETWQQELGYAHTNLAAIHEARGESAAALKAIGESLRIKQILWEADPEKESRHYDLVNAMAWKGRVLLASGDLHAAGDFYGMAAAEAGALVTAHPDHTLYRELQSSLLYLYGKIIERFGDNDRAEEHFQASRELARQLVDHDPENASWRLDLTVSQVGLGLHKMRVGDLAGAEQFLAPAAAVSAELVDMDPGNVSYLQEYAEAQWGLAWLATERGDLVQARQSLDQSLTAARRAKDLNSDDLAIHILARCLVTAGEIAARDGRPDEANIAWREAYEMLRPVAEVTRQDSTLEIWARVLTHLGQTADARSVSEDLLAMGFVRLDFMAFRAEHGL